MSDFERPINEMHELRQRVAELEGMRSEALHYQREFHRMRDRLAAAESQLHSTSVTLNRAATRLAAAKETINRASRIMHGEGVEDQGHAYDLALRLLDAYLADTHRMHMETIKEG